MFKAHDILSRTHQSSILLLAESCSLFKNLLEFENLMMKEALEKGIVSGLHHQGE